MRPNYLLCKDERGQVVPFEQDGCQYVDGSLQADLPFRRCVLTSPRNHSRGIYPTIARGRCADDDASDPRIRAPLYIHHNTNSISTLFQVSHFIVSQVNFHVVPLRASVVL